jgi:hypothetical protein
MAKRSGTLNGPGYLHTHPHPHQPRGHCFGIGRPGRLACWKTVSGMDGIFPGDNGGDERDRILFPVSRFHTGLCGGCDFLFILATAIYALYGRRLSGAWARIYILSALTALYLNFFVLVAQLFQKTPALKELAPPQTEPPFAVSQAIVLVLFAVLGIAAVRKSRVDSLRA